MTKARQKTIHTFTIDFTSEIDDYRYQGSFSCKKLSIYDTSALGVRKAQLNGGMHHDPNNPGRGVDEDTDEYNSMVAHLELALTVTPPWWDLHKISDNDLVLAVYREVATFENTFLGRKRHAEADTGLLDSSEGTGDRDVSPANTVRELGEVVEREVSSALEP
jgi:hypothetical protein